MCCLTTSWGGTIPLTPPSGWPWLNYSLFLPKVIFKLIHASTRMCTSIYIYFLTFFWSMPPLYTVIYRCTKWNNRSSVHGFLATNGHYFVSNNKLLFFFFFSFLEQKHSFWLSTHSSEKFIYYIAYVIFVGVQLSMCYAMLVFLSYNLRVQNYPILDFIGTLIFCLTE